MSYEEDMDTLKKFVKEKNEEIQAIDSRNLEKLRNTLITGEAGGGLVKVDWHPTNGFQNVTIDPMIASDTKLIGDLVKAAFNDVFTRYANAYQEVDNIYHQLIENAMLETKEEVKKYPSLTEQVPINTKNLN